MEQQEKFDSPPVPDSVEKQANSKELPTILLLERLRNPIIRKQIIDLFYEAEQSRMDEMITTVLKDKDGKPLRDGKKFVVEKRPYAPKTREKIEKGFDRNFARIEKDTPISFDTDEPSAGGGPGGREIGTKLKRARTRLTITIIAVIEANDDEMKLYSMPKRRTRPKNSAIIRFESGPAMATMASPQRLFRKLCGLYGTGLAQPKMKPALVKIKSAGRIIEPKISRCLRGFKVKRPSDLAVGSPRESAATP